MKRVFLVFASLCLFSAMAFCSGGASGALFGMSQPTWDPNFLGLPIDAVNMPFDIKYAGGYGYNVDDDGFIIGHFALAFAYPGLVGLEDGKDAHIAGGVGGLILGQRIIGTDFIHLDFASRLGLGGSYVEYSPDAGLSWNRSGYFLLYAEPYVELGIGFWPWMHLSATLGYQMMINWMPGIPGSKLFTRSPTIGVSLTFGSFYF